MSHRALGVRRRAEVIQWKVSIPLELALEVELLLTPKETGKPVYGARSQLITELLLTHLKTLKEGMKHDF